MPRGSLLNVTLQTREPRRVPCSIAPLCGGNTLTDAPPGPSWFPGLVLYPNVPNPFNPATRISFDLAERGVVTMRIYDVAGRVVRSILQDEQLAPGRHHRVWDGRDDRGQGTSSGVYFCRVRAGGEGAKCRLVLVR